MSDSDHARRPSRWSEQLARDTPRARRRVHRKVRTGCAACKVRHQKCDEQRPTCAGCQRHSTNCRYDSTSPETSTTRDSSLQPSSCVTMMPVAGSAPGLNLQHLELLHQYLTSTCMATAQRPEMTAYAQLSVPQLAQNYPFVMRGILAMAATHLSCLRPERRAHYQAAATANQLDAIPEFRRCLQDIGEKNCHALIFFAKSLVWCSFADLSSSSTSCQSVDNNWLPAWFHLLRGSCQIVQRSRLWIHNGPHLALTIPADFDGEDNSDLIYLDSFTAQMITSTSSHTCADALASLRQSFIIASIHEHNTPLRNALNYWIGGISDEYMDLVQMRDPWALVILAHFCVLVHRSETVAFMKGHGSQLLERILGFLGPEWCTWVSWPCHQISPGCTTKGFNQDSGMTSSRPSMNAVLL